MNYILKILIFKYIFLSIIAKKYDIKLLFLDICKISDIDLDKENAINITLSSSRMDRKTLIVSSNITVPKKIGPVTVNFRAYQLQRSLVRDLEYKMENLSCHHEDVIKSLALMRLGIDKQCFLIPGNYESQNVTVGDIGDVFSRSVMTPGKYSYDVEILTTKGIVCCISISMEYKI